MTLPARSLLTRQSSANKADDVIAVTGEAEDISRALAGDVQVSSQYSPLIIDVSGRPNLPADKLKCSELRDLVSLRRAKSRWIKRHYYHPLVCSIFVRPRVTLARLLSQHSLTMQNGGTYPQSAAYRTLPYIERLNPVGCEAVS